MPHRAEHHTSSSAERKKSHGHHIESHHRGERAKEGKRESVERERKGHVQERVSEDEERAMAARRQINILAKKPLVQEARKVAERLSQSFFETYGVYPSQIASEEEAKKVWSKDTGFFRRIAVKLSGAENMEALDSWKAWYEADQEMEAMKAEGGNVSAEERKKEHGQTAEDMKQIMEFPGKGIIDVATDLVSPGVVQVIREKGKVIAETKKVEEQIEAESHRGKAARAAGMLLNRVGFIAQKQKGYEEFDLSVDKIEAMDVFTLESQLHRFDERVGKEGLKSMELANEPDAADSKEAQREAKELQKNIKMLGGSYDKQIDKFEEEYKAYLETPAGMQEALVTALQHLEMLRNQSMSLSAETMAAYGEALLDEQRHIADIESALVAVKDRMNKDAGKEVYGSSSQAKTFLLLQEGIKDLYEEEQKRVRTGGRQSMKSRVGMYGTKQEMPSPGFVGGFGSVESISAERPAVVPRGKKKEQVEAVTAKVAEPKVEEAIEDLTESAAFAEEGLNEEQNASLTRYANSIKTKDKNRRAELIEARIEKLKGEQATYAKSTEEKAKKEPEKETAEKALAVWIDGISQLKKDIEDAEQKIDSYTYREYTTLNSRQSDLVETGEKEFKESEAYEKASAELELLRKRQMGIFSHLRDKQGMRERAQYEDRVKQIEKGWSEKRGYDVGTTKTPVEKKIKTVESRAARFLGKENTEHIKELIEVAAQNFVEMAESNKDDAGLQAELKELKLLAYRMELLPEKYAYQLGLAKEKQDEDAKKFIKRVNGILKIKTQAIAEILRHEEKKAA